MKRSGPIGVQHQGLNLMRRRKEAVPPLGVLRFIAVGVIVCLPIFGQTVPSFLVRPIAGGYRGPSLNLGDDGLALQAYVGPVSVATDDFNNIFIADAANNRVRKVAPDGVISTIAGNGTLGSGGDGGPALSAELLGAQTVVLDHIGNTYIGECYGTNPPTLHQLRVVDSSGLINTVPVQFSCVVSLATDTTNNLYVLGAVSPGQALQIFKITPGGPSKLLAGSGINGYSGDGGPAINAQFSQSTGIAFDNRTGVLYVADTGNSRVRAIYPNGTIQTVAGTGSSGFTGDGGLALAADLNNPEALAVDASSNVYIADLGNDRIRLLTPAGLISTVAGNGVRDQGATPFNPPGGTYPGNGDGGPALLAAISPYGLATDVGGGLYFLSGTTVRELISSSPTIGCMYSAVPPQVDLPNTGGSTTIDVTAALSSCPWLALATTSWIEVTASTGTGSGTVNVTATPNPLSASRNVLIPVAGQIVSVTQAGTTCTYTLSTQVISVPASGQSGTINVSANLPDCSWTATSNVAWLFVISGGSGEGNGAVTYTAAQNIAIGRTGTITIAGITFTVKQQAAPGFPDVSIVASAATGTSPFAAGQLVSIYGSQLGPSVGSGGQLGPGGVVTTSNAGTQVLFDGTAAPILYTSSGQVNTVIPCEVAGHSSTQLVVEFMGAQSAPVTVPLSQAAPGIFTSDGTGQGQAAALNQDFSFNSPSNPAPRGSIITFYATGVGPTSPCADGAIYQSNFPTLTLPVIVGIAGGGARVEYAGQAPDLVSGVAQFNAKVTMDAATGVVPLVLDVGGVFSPNGVTIAVK